MEIILSTGKETLLELNKNPSGDNIAAVQRNLNFLLDKLLNNIIQGKVSAANEKKMKNKLRYNIINYLLEQMTDLTIEKNKYKIDDIKKQLTECIDQLPACTDKWA